MIIWTLTPRGLVGTENQALGVAKALSGTTIISKKILLKRPFRWWSPFLSWGEGPGMMTADSDVMAPPWPDVLIAAGRQAVGMARYIKRASGGRTFVCILQNPKISPRYFDLVAMPVHDGGKSGCHPRAGGDPSCPHDSKVDQWAPASAGAINILLTNGAPNLITDESLVMARQEWHDVLDPLPAPRTALLIGGNSRTHRLGTATMDALIAHVQNVYAKRGGALMITVSRRTPMDLRERLRAAFAVSVPSPPVGEGARATARAGEGIQHSLSPHPNPPPQGGREQTAMPSVILYTGDGPNPYPGFLAYADYIICTTDSTSMISDAATTGKPIEFFPLPGGSRRQDRFMTHCRDLGVGVPGAHYTPWRDAERVAEVIEKMIKERAV